MPDIGGLCFVSVLVGLFYLSGRISSRSLWKKGLRSEGTILTIYEFAWGDGSGWSIGNNIQYEFVDQKGNRRRGTAIYNESRLGSLREGDSLTIVYRASNPKVNCPEAYVGPPHKRTVKHGKL